MDTQTLQLIIQIAVLFISLTFHEFMHAWTASYLGDPTAKAAGRVSLNPIAHIDPFGTIFLPIFLIFVGSPIVFGWAKPVPINPNNFKNYRLGQLLTALAGPMANLIFVLLFAAVFKALPNQDTVFGFFASRMILINAFLMVFNLIPVPPLDGSKVLYGFLPFETIRKLEMYGPFILIPLVLFFSSYIVMPIVNILFRLLGLS